MLYPIENVRSGLILGIYEADLVEEALDLLAQDAGHVDLMPEFQQGQMDW